MPSPTCEVKDGGGAYTATTNGVDVTPANTVTIRLASTAGVTTWSITCIGTDETSDASTVTSGLTVDGVTKTATFTAPVAGKAYLFQSRVNGGIDQNGTSAPALTTTFIVHTLTGSGLRVGALGETTEAGSFGWTSKVNDVIRNGGGGGGGDYETANSALTSATGQRDTTNATPEILATGTAIPTGTTRTVWAEVKCVAGGARATRSFYCKREFNNYGGTVTAGTQQELDGPGNLTAIGTPLTSAEVNIEITGQTTRVEAVGIAATDLRWTFKVETLDMAAPAASGPPYDLATRALTGWWEGDDYDAGTGTWTGKASAGTSGANDLTEATNKPSVGATLNGIATVDFARASSQKLTADGNIATYLSSSQYAFAVLLKARAWANDDPDANLADGIFADSNGIFSLSGRTTGPGLILEHYDTLGADTRATGSSDVGSWQLVIGRYSSSTGFLELSDDGGATWGTPVACLDLNWSSPVGAIYVGCEYVLTKFFDGEMATLIFQDSHWNNTDVANVVSYINWRWGTTF